MGEHRSTGYKYELIGTQHSDKSVMTLYCPSTRVTGGLCPPMTHLGTEWVYPATCTQLQACCCQLWSTPPMWRDQFAKDIQALIQRSQHDSVLVVGGIQIDNIIYIYIYVAGRNVYNINIYGKEISIYCNKECY